MAQIIVREIFWRQNSPYGTFVQDDEVTIKYDTSTELVVVENNGIVITSGDSIPLFFTYNARPASYYKTEKDFKPLICDGTVRVTLERDISVFPYVTITRFSDSPSCAVSPTVCDLTIGSIPTVVNESAQGASDGSITVSATSSNGSIEYKLNSDFVYGAGQSSATFSGLTSGSYRVYARDAANCSANMVVNVSYDRVYGTLYTLEYDDRVGNQSKIEIKERDYAGASTDVCGSGNPLLISVRGEGEQDKFIPILGTQLQVGLSSETNFKYLGLFTSDPNKYRVIFSKDFGSGYETLLTTKFLPNQYKEQYKAPPYDVSFLSTDGLASLSNIPFLDAGGNKFTGVYRCLDLIAYCLKNTGLSLNIRVAVNLYATTMDTTAADDPLDQAYVDVQAYYLSENPNCLDIIRFILEPFGAQLVQWNNVWNIVRVEEKVDEYDYREFDESGVYVSNSSYNPVLISQESTQTNLIWVSAPDMEMNPAYGTMRLKYVLGLKSNIILNGDFKLKSEFNTFLGLSPDITGFQLIANGDDGVILVYQIVDQDKVKPYADYTNVTTDKNNIAIGLQNAAGNAYLLSKPVNLVMGSADQIKFAIRIGLPIFSQEYPYVKLRCVVQYGTYYLQGDGTWTTSATELIFFVKEYGKFVEFNVTANRPIFSASTGLDLTVTVYHAYAFHAEFTASADLKNKVTVGLGIGHRTEWYDSGGFDLYYYELENNTSAESIPNIVRPNDYHATTNPVQWILKTQRDTGIFIDTSFYIDYINITYFYNGTLPPQFFEADISGEENNQNIFEKSVVHGSLSEIIQTNAVIIPIFSFNPAIFADIQYIDVPIQNAEDVYTGYFRDSSGVGFENWSRSYFSEELPLHEILLKSYAAQYSSPWRRIIGALTGSDYVTPISSIREQNDNDRMYYPVALEIDDKNRVFSGEYLELTDLVTTDEGEETGVGFTTGFSIGFNA
jgi:hypothetical protein